MYVYEKQGDAPGMKVRAFNPPHGYKRLWKELERKEECCFVWTIGKYAIGDISLDEYLDRILDHLYKDGARHTYDDKPGRLYELLACDYVSGAVKRLMFEPDLQLLSQDGRLASLRS